MRVYKGICRIYKIKINMSVIESFFALGYERLEANKDMLRLLKLPARAKNTVEEEIAAIPSFTLEELRSKAALTNIDYYESEPAQIKAAYSGYIQRMCDLGNLIIVAARKTADKNAQPFEQENKKTREETFKKFGLEAQ